MKRALVSLLVLAGALSATPALADEPKPQEASAGAVASGRTALREGMALREGGDVKGALGRLQSAWDFIPTPITGFELGKTHLMLGHVLQAHELFARVGRLAPSPEESSRSQTARDEATRLMKEVEPRIPSLKIKVTIPQNATVEVKVDDEKVPLVNNETKLLVEVGAHDVTAKAGDGPEQKVHIEVAESESKDVPLTPQWLPPAPKPVLSNSGQVVYVRQTNPLTFVGFSFAAAGLIVTTIGTIVYVNAREDAQDRCGKFYCPPPTQGFTNTANAVDDAQFRSANARYNAGVIMMVAGSITMAIFGGIGAVFATRPVKERVVADAPSPITIKPTVGLGGAGLQGSF